MIHLVLGFQGCGKTVYSVMRAILAQAQGKTIYSNVHLIGVKYKKLKYDDIINCRLENAFVLIDEIHQILPARRSLSKTSIKICDGFLSMVRKKGLEIYGTTQTERKVDIRFREEADYIHACEKYVYTKDGIYHKCAGHERFSKKVPVIIQTTVIEKYSGNVIKSAFIANKYYSSYDTNQIILIEGLQ